MNERAFVERRRGDWEQLEATLKKAGKGLKRLSREELNQFGRLYRRVAGDLAYVQTHAVSIQLVDYLNDLVGRGHGLLYTREGKSFATALRDYFYGIPDVVRRRKWFILLAFAITLVAEIIGYYVSLRHPQLAMLFVPENLQSSLEAWKAGGGSDRSAAEATAFTGQLWINNSRVSLLAFASGITWGILTVYLLATNGLLFGVFVGEVSKVGQTANLWAGVLPHGVTEILAIYLSAGGGLLLAKALISPGDKPRLAALKSVSDDALNLLTFAVIMLVLAAFIEAWFSHRPLQNSIKFAFAGLSFVAWLAYWIGVRDPRKTTNRRD